MFITMLALKDYDDIVRYTAFQLSRRAHKTEEEVLDALKVLSSPDTKRIEPQEFDGRRIEKVQDGWLVLNGPLYREMMSHASKARRRAYKTEWEKNKRAKKSHIPGESQGSKAYNDGNDRGGDAIASELRETPLPYTPTPAETPAPSHPPEEPFQRSVCTIPPSALLPPASP